MVLDLLYSSQNMIQNKITSKITVVESILIGENEDIESNFILKTGLIFKEYWKSKNNESNKFIKYLLRYVYDVRSSIVHGNEEKIEKLYNKLLQQNEHIKEMIKKDLIEYKERKKMALEIAYLVSLVSSRVVVKKWLTDPNYIHYMKEIKS